MKESESEGGRSGWLKALGGLRAGRPRQQGRALYSVKRMRGRGRQRWARDGGDVQGVMGLGVLAVVVAVGQGGSLVGGRCEDAKETMGCTGGLG